MRPRPRCAGAPRAPPRAAPSSSTGTGPRPSWGRGRGRSARPASRSARDAAITWWPPLVRLAVGRRRDAPPDQAGQHDDRDEVRQRSKNWPGSGAEDVTELARRAGRTLIDCPSALRRGEQQRRAERAERRPAPEDHRRQGDEPAAGGHPCLERVRALQREVRPAEPGEDAADDDVPVAQPDDVDADRLGRLADARRRRASAGPSGTGRAGPGGR